MQSQIEKAYSLIYPSAVFENFFSSEKKTFSIKEDLFKDSGKEKSILNDCFAFTLMAVTVGKGLEEEVENLKDEDFASCAILDAAGSEAAEQCANFVSRIVRKEASAKECNLGQRFSPGYGSWPPHASKRIFKYIPAEKIGLEITGSGLLNPRKSITAVQPWWHK